MSWIGERVEPSVKRVIIGLLGVGAIGIGSWVGVQNSELYEPIAEIPFVLAITCFLGAVSVYATQSVVTLIDHRISSSGGKSEWVVLLGKLGICVVLLLVGASFIALLNAGFYFAFDRAWPISPAQGGRIQFLFLIGIVLTPIIVSAFAASYQATARRAK